MIYFKPKSQAEPIVEFLGPIQDLSTSKTLVLYRPLGEEVRARQEADFYAVFERHQPDPLHYFDPFA